jgi:hypothetical protein
MSIVVRHSSNHVPALGTAGLERNDLRAGYCATLCFMTVEGDFVDVHVTAQHLEHLAYLLKDLERFTKAERSLET